MLCICRVSSKQHDNCVDCDNFVDIGLGGGGGGCDMMKYIYDKISPLFGIVLLTWVRPYHTDFSA